MRVVSELSGTGLSHNLSLKAFARILYCIGTNI